MEKTADKKTAAAAKKRTAETTCAYAAKSRASASACTAPTRYRVVSACICGGKYREPGEVVAMPRYGCCPDHLAALDGDETDAGTNAPQQDDTRGATLDDIGLGAMTDAADMTSLDANR